VDGYHPDWVGGLVTGIAIVLSLLAGVTMWPQRGHRKKVVVIAVCIGPSYPLPPVPYFGILESSAAVRASDALELTASAPRSARSDRGQSCGAGSPRRVESPLSRKYAGRRQGRR